MICTSAADLSSAQTFVELDGFLPGSRTTVKLEGLNLTGSIKLKTARAMLEALEAKGLLDRARIIESTSGNLGVALAVICAVKRYPITLVTDPNANERSVQYMRAMGAEVVTVRERDENGGYLHTRLRYIHERLAADPSLIWLNQYASAANVAAHREGTGAEILANYGVPDWLFVAVGTSGTLMGILQYLRWTEAATTVVGVDAVGSVTFGEPPARRWIPGLGASRRPEIFTDDGSFRKVVVSELDTILTCRLVARRYGLLLGGSSGTSLAALLASRAEIPPGSRVLVISPDMGERYLDTVYNDEWVTRRFGAEAVRWLSHPDAVDQIRNRLSARPSADFAAGKVMLP